MSRHPMGLDVKIVRYHTKRKRPSSRLESPVSARKPSQLPPEPPPAVLKIFRERLAGRELQAFETIFGVRTTAQQLENAITEWMSDSAASPSRFIILMQLWAAKGRGLPHKEIVTALGVTRATVSGLMAALERDGLVKSAECGDDRRSVLASLTPKGEAIVAKAFEINKGRVRTAFTGFSPAELTTLATLLARVRQGFCAMSAEGAEPRDAKRESKRRRASG